MFTTHMIEYRGGPMCGDCERYRLVDAIVIIQGSFVHVYLKSETSQPGKPWPYIYEKAYRDIDEVKASYPDMDYFDAK